MLVQFLFVAWLPLSISSRPKWIQMLGEWSTARCTKHRTRQKPTLRPANRHDVAALSRPVTYRPGEAVRCGATGLPVGAFCLFFFLFYCLALHQGQWWWGICSEIWMSLLFSPGCALHKAYLSSPLFLTQRAQTHSHGQLPFNSQLGIRKLECWGELHKKNINVNKKTGTCVAVSCHRKEC